MVNQYRGEIKAQIDGKPHILCLTLGGLAHLETVFECGDLSQLLDRFSNGKIKAGELLEIITEGLRGGGLDVSCDEVSKMKINGGVMGAVELVTQLLNATFSPQDHPKPVDEIK